MYEKFGQFIDGKWQQAEKKETYDVINPATEEVIGKASKASSIEVQKALKSAEKGLEVWKNTAPWQRAYVLRKIADMMREKKETYDVINPATEEVIGKASKASSIEVQKALKSAEKGLEVWKNTAPWQRAYVLRKIADMMSCLLYTSDAADD